MTDVVLEYVNHSQPPKITLALYNDMYIDSVYLNIKFLAVDYRLQTVIRDKMMRTDPITPSEWLVKLRLRSLGNTDQLMKTDGAPYRELLKRNIVNTGPSFLIT